MKELHTVIVHCRIYFNSYQERQGVLVKAEQSLENKFYKLYGNKENDQITVYSCAYLTKDWNNLPYIPTKYLI